MGYYCVRPAYTWGDGRIYYVFESGSEKILDPLKLDIRRGMDVWEAATEGVIRFIEGRNPNFPPAPKDTVDKYPQTIVIKRGGSNSCDIGLAGIKENKRQFTCQPDIPFHSILHELGHGIGLLHEHERPDGHLFGVKLKPDIDLTVRRRNEGAYGVYSTAFDYNSIMLYTNGSSYDVADFGASLKFMGKGMGSVTTLSAADLETVRHVYGGSHPPQPQPQRPAATVADAPKRELLRIKVDDNVVAKLNAGQIHPKLDRAIVDKVQRSFPKDAKDTAVKRKSATEWEIAVKGAQTKTYIVRMDKTELVVFT